MHTDVHNVIVAWLLVWREGGRVELLRNVLAFAELHQPHVHIRVPVTKLALGLCKRAAVYGLKYILVVKEFLRDLERIGVVLA